MTRDPYTNALIAHDVASAALSEAKDRVDTKAIKKAEVALRHAKTDCLRFGRYTLVKLA